MQILQLYKLIIIVTEDINGSNKYFFKLEKLTMFFSVFQLSNQVAYLLNIHNYLLKFNLFRITCLVYPTINKALLINIFYFVNPLKYKWLWTSPLSGTKTFCWDLILKNANYFTIRQFPTALKPHYKIQVQTPNQY